MVVLMDIAVLHRVVPTRATGKMKSNAPKKAFAVLGVFGLRDNCDFAKMVFTVPS